MSKLTLALVAALAATAGCGKKDACTAAITATSDAEKAEADKLMEKMSAEDKKLMEPEFKKAVAKSDAKFAQTIKVCQDGKWSEEVTNCLKSSTDRKAAGACMEKLTPEQLSLAMKAMADKPADKAADKPADKAADKPADNAADDKPAAVAGGLPQECQDYKAAIEAVMKCDKMSSARDAMKQGYDAMAQGWADIGAMPAEAQKAMADGCKQGVDALKQTMTAMGC